jgi:hypothetical protein
MHQRRLPICFAHSQRRVLREVVADKHLRVCPLQPKVGSSYEANAQFPMNLPEVGLGKGSYRVLRFVT